MRTRILLAVVATLTFLAFVNGVASAQSLDCSALPDSVCASGEVPSLESERASLIAQLQQRDAQNAALGGEQTWLDGLGACGEDVECFKGAYAAHNQSLRDAVSAAPPADETPVEELPTDPTAFPPLPEIEDAPPLPRMERARIREGPIYVPSGLPGWGFFLTIGITLLLFNVLLRARAKHRREAHAEQAQMRDNWG